MWVGFPAISGAPTPTPTTPAISAAPTSVVFRRTATSSQRGAARRSGSARGRTSVLIGASLVPHPWVEDDVRQVHHEVDEHVDARDAQHDALDDGGVAAEHRRDDQPAKPRDVEDGLDDDRAGDQHREADAD